RSFLSARPDDLLRFGNRFAGKSEEAPTRLGDRGNGDTRPQTNQDRQHTQHERLLGQQIEADYASRQQRQRQREFQRIGHCGLPPAITWQWLRESYPHPAVLETVALPVELYP